MAHLRLGVDRRQNPAIVKLAHRVDTSSNLQFGNSLDLSLTRITLIITAQDHDAAFGWLIFIVQRVGCTDNNNSLVVIYVLEPVYAVARYRS